MNIDDLLCVGAVDNILVSSTIGRNKLLIPGEVISAIINGTDELLAELREMGVEMCIRDSNGTIYLMDEIHTPDSSRYFYAEGPSCVWSTGEEEEIVKYMSLLDNVLQSEENSFKLYILSVHFPKAA